MKRIGVIDIGSSSIRMLISEIDNTGSYKIIDELKESVKLGADMLVNETLSFEIMQKAIKILKIFKHFCNAINVDEIITVATEPVRRAKNNLDFVEMITRELNLHVLTLSESDEAYYSYFGVINSMYVNNALLIDLGGSSMQLCWIKDGKLFKHTTLTLGASNLTHMFNLEDVISSQNEENLRLFLKKTYDQIPWLFETKFDSIIGIGGTVRNIGKIDRKIKRYFLDIHHNYEISKDDIHSIYNSVKSKNLRQRKRIEGLSEDRAEIFVAPTCAVSLLMDSLNIDKLFVCGKGLREGLIYTYIHKNRTTLDDILNYSLNSILYNHNINKDHASNVYRITKSIFEKLTDIHHLDSSYNNIIKTASILHDSGLSIRYYDHNKHSFYMILNSEINGLSHKELLMSALVASSHRYTEFDINIMQFHGLVNRLDLQCIEKMGLILKISESLDKSTTGTVKDIKCTITNDQVMMEVFSDNDIELELMDAQKAIPFFKDIFDKDLIIKRAE